MVKLMPDQQQDFVRAEPKAFMAVTGKWGQRGATNVVLKAAKKGRVREALEAAWRNTAPKRMCGGVGWRRAERLMVAGQRVDGGGGLNAIYS